MPGESSLRDVLRNMLDYGDLSFRDFVELALYHPEFGYYTRAGNPVGKGGDYVTAPSLSPAFSFAIGSLFREFLRRAEGALCSFVDIGCGDGSLVRAVASENGFETARFFGVDRSLSRAIEHPRVTYLRSFDEVPRDGLHFVFSNELYDAIPFARLVNRGEHLHELWVQEREDVLDWSEHEAAPLYDDYFAERGIELAEGQFVDIALEWEALHADILGHVDRGLFITIDYGYPAAKLFHPRARRFGTAAAYSGQRVHRDLLANPGEQDLTAHINFSDLERAGERAGAATLFFDVLAKFLLTIGITEHELFRPVHEVSISGAEEGMELIGAREDARRLVLPDGIGMDLKVLVQAKGVATEGWPFLSALPAITR
ncbi:MAG TPA: SAM-dependent methyltransferase [Thermoanaerobaculia bacterium]|nr:SAM-dependent methyltransferase [Thermoanaerobaculia bacterium]